MLTVGEYARRTARAQRLWLGFVIAVTVACGVLLLRSEAAPSLRSAGSTIAWLIYLAGAVAILYQPRMGVYLILFFGLIADKALMYWYPFVSNFSSSESLMYLNEAVIVSPLEVYLVLTLLAWLGRAAAQRRLNLYQGPLFWPVIIWIGFVVFGLVYGISRGGNLNIALWECRPMFYLPVMLVLTSNLIQTREQVNRLVWTAMLALFIHGGIIGVYYYFVVLAGQISRIESIVEHAAAVRMNTVYIMAIAVWMYKASRMKRVMLPLFVPLMFITYIVAQRRASFVGLGLGLVLLGIVLFKANRHLFWRIAPPAALVALLYLGAFWNNQGPLGLAARAVKGIVVSDSGNAQENSSDAYRVIENINNLFTIRAVPLTGVGFGNKFFIVAQLPDISFFEWWEYIVHNSIIWMWMKTGVGGFLAMLFMVGAALSQGGRALWKMPGRDMSAIALVAVAYLFMHFVYAYVDMSWDSQSMLYVGAMMGLLNSLEIIVAKPLPAPSQLDAPRKLQLWAAQPSSHLRPAGRQSS